MNKERVYARTWEDRPSGKFITVIVTVNDDPFEEGGIEYTVKVEVN